MSKKRVSIYIDSELWDSVKEGAWRRRISASALFEKLVRGEIAFGDHVRVEDAMEVVKETAYKFKERGEREIKSRVAASILDKDELAILERAQSNIPFKGGYSKAQQVGKKVK